MIKDDALNGIDSLTSASLGDLFDQCANDPNLAAMLVQGNEELVSQLNMLNDKNALFSSTTGEKIDLDGPVTKESLDPIISLNSLSPTE
mmetsp:Transcript_10117/g.8869  ORF Transcript_10117/g.8869 Transcript_10117/m.8869 type:complete len:89 (-) Transcript_10117:1776-2042(-)